MDDLIPRSKGVKGELTMNQTEMLSVVYRYPLPEAVFDSQLLLKQPEHLLHSLQIYVGPLPGQDQTSILFGRLFVQVGRQGGQSVRRSPTRTRE